MYRIDIFTLAPKQPKGKNKSKKVGSAWYETKEQAEDAARALRQPKKEFTYIPREGAKQVTRKLFGFTTSNPVEDAKY